LEAVPRGDRLWLTDCRASPTKERVPVSVARIQPLIRKFERGLRLTDEERAALENLPLRVQPIRTDQDIVREGDRPARCFVLLEGFAVAFKRTGPGKRQIMTFHIAGDIPDLQSLHIRRLDNTVSTITPCRVGFIEHEALIDLCTRFPRLTNALWRETLTDAAIFKEWVLNVGRRDAYTGMAHLICEVVTRMRAVGLVADDRCAFPMTQNELADAVGISAVHVNRTLQELRAAGLITLARGKLHILEWEALKAAGDFAPDYLYLEQERAA
jgi:CRP-like cAMP-binding protein